MHCHECFSLPGDEDTRLRVQDCIERRLDELGRILDEASRTGSLPPVGDIGIPPRRLWNTGAWDSVVASQTATHIPRQQLAGLASAYLFVHKNDDLGPLEARNWSELAAIMGPGRRLDPASEAELRKAIGMARGDSRIMAGLSLNLIRAINKQKLPFSQDDLKQITAA
jgi:hypothetical protein